MVVVTVLIHAIGLMLLSRLSRVLALEAAEEGLAPLSPRGVALVLGLVLGLFLLHGIEIWLYAGLFLQIGAVSNFRDAVYFSTETYAAIGFSDEFVSEPWKILGAIEGINGLLLLGWSTAFFVTLISRLVRN